MEKLLSAGFLHSDLTNLDKDYGEGTTVLVKATLDTGVSANTIYDILKLTGKLGLQLFLDFYNSNKVGFKVVDRVDDGSVAIDPIASQDNKLMAFLLDKILPVVLDKLVQNYLTDENIDKLVKFLTDLILSKLK